MIDRDSITDADIQRLHDATQQLGAAFYAMLMEVKPKIEAALEAMNTPEVQAALDEWERLKALDEDGEAE